MGARQMRIDLYVKGWRLGGKVKHIMHFFAAFLLLWSCMMLLACIPPFGLFNLPSTTYNLTGNIVVSARSFVNGALLYGCLFCMVAIAIDGKVGAVFILPWMPVLWVSSCFLASLRPLLIPLLVGSLLATLSFGALLLVPLVTWRRPSSPSYGLWTHVFLSLMNAFIYAPIFASAEIMASVGISSKLSTAIRERVQELLPTTSPKRSLKFGKEKEEAKPNALLSFFGRFRVRPAYAYWTSSSFRLWSMGRSSTDDVAKAILEADYSYNKLPGVPEGNEEEIVEEEDIKNDERNAKIANAVASNIAGCSITRAAQVRQSLGESQSSKGENGGRTLRIEDLKDKFAAAQVEDLEDGGEMDRALAIAEKENSKLFQSLERRAKSSPDGTIPFLSRTQNVIVNSSTTPQSEDKLIDLVRNLAIGQSSSDACEH